MDYLNKSVDLIVKNTNLNKHYATINLINVEAQIYAEEIYKFTQQNINNFKFNKSYFYLAAAKVISKYKIK